MRRAFVILLVLALVAVVVADRLVGRDGDEGPVLRVRVTTLPEDATRLDLSDSLPGQARTFPLEVKSRADRSVTLQARLESDAEGLAARIHPPVTLLPQATAAARLQFLLPDRPMRFEGRVVLESPDVPAWRRVYEVQGSVVDRPIPGRYVRTRPAGIDAGVVRPGTRHPFTIVIESYGDERIRVDELRTSDPDRIGLDRAVEPGAIVMPGGELQLHGSVTVPKTPGEYRGQVILRTDAQNRRDGIVMVPVTANVVPDYGARPAVYGPRTLYPVHPTPISVVLAAREGAAPFVVAEVEGHERHLELESRGGEEPAAEQTVTFALRRDAPTDARRVQEVRVRFRLEPVGEVVTWPVRLRLLPPVYPQPDRVDFGTVEAGTPALREVALATVGLREFEVTGATTLDGRFGTNVMTHGRGMQWRIQVFVPAGTPAGTLEDWLVVKTTDPDVPEVRVPLHAVVR